MCKINCNGFNRALLIMAMHYDEPFRSLVMETILRIRMNTPSNKSPGIVTSYFIHEGLDFEVSFSLYNDFIEVQNFTFKRLNSFGLNVYVDDLESMIHSLFITQQE